MHRTGCIEHHKKPIITSTASLNLRCVCYDYYYFFFILSYNLGMDVSGCVTIWCHGSVGRFSRSVCLVCRSVIEGEGRQCSRQNGLMRHEALTVSEVGILSGGDGRRHFPAAKTRRGPTTPEPPPDHGTVPTRAHRRWLWLGLWL